MRDLENILEELKKEDDFEELSKIDLPEWIYKVMDNYLNLENDLKSGRESIELYTGEVTNMFLIGVKHERVKASYDFKSYVEGYKEGLFIALFGNDDSATSIKRLEKIDSLELEDTLKIFEKSRYSALCQSPTERGKINAQIDTIRAKLGQFFGGPNI